MSSIPNMTGRTGLLAVVTLIAVMAVCAAVALAQHPEDQDANKGGTGLTSMAGDWALGAGDDLAYANQTIDLDGNLTIAGGGRLVLRNVTLVLHGWPWALQEIRLNAGGELAISDLDGDPATTSDRSTVRANDSAVHYYFKAYAGSKLLLRNSLVLDCGELFNLQGLQAGIYLATADVTMESVEIANGYCGIFIDDVSPTIVNCSIHDNDWVGVYVDNGAEPTLVGCQIKDNAREGVSVKGQSDLTMRGCRVEGNARGVLVDFAYLTADGCVMRNNNATPDLNLPHNAQVDLYNCTLSTNAGWKAVTMENSSMSSTNGNFDLGRITMVASIFKYQHFINVIVTWSDSVFTPIPGVTVTIVDAEARLSEFVTGADGRVAWVPMTVIEYDNTGGTLRTYTYNPFQVSATMGQETKDEFVDARYATATVTFRFNDITDPTAVPPSSMTVDVGINATLDGGRSTDNVAIAEWNWSFEEMGATVNLEGEMAVYAFKEAKIYSVTLKVTDTSGRSGSRGSATFTVTAVDRTPPSAKAGPNVVASEGEVVRFDGSASTDNVGVVGYTWSFTYDSAPRSLPGVTTQWTFNIPGVYTVVLTVEDAAGLSASASFTVTVSDTTAPVTGAALDSSKPPAGRLYSEIVQAVFTVAGERVNDYTTFYRINGGEWRTFTGSLGFGDGLENGDGTYTIDYYSVDGSMNTEQTKTIEAFTVDATAPTFSELDPAVSPFSTVEPSHVISGLTEPGVTLTINGQDVTVAASGRFAHNVTLVAGDNPFTMIAKDAAGHQTDKVIVISYQEQKTDRDDAGPNWAIIGGILVAGVVLVVIAYWFISRKK